MKISIPTQIFTFLMVLES